MWRIGWARNNASKWQIGFNSAFKGLKSINQHEGKLRATTFMFESFWDKTWSEWEVRTLGVAHSYIIVRHVRVGQKETLLTYLLVCLVVVCLYGHSASYYPYSYLVWEILGHELRFLEWIKVNFSINWSKMLSFQTLYICIIYFSVNPLNTELNPICQ